MKFLKFLVTLFFIGIASNSVFAQPGPLSAVAWSPNGQVIATISNDGEVQLVDVLSGSTLAQFETAPFSSQVADRRIHSSLAWKSDSQYLATISTNDQILRIWDVSSLPQITLLAELSNVTSAGAPMILAWSADGQFLANAELANTDGGGTLFIWEVREDDYQSVGTMRLDSYDVAWAAHRNQLAVGGVNTVSIIAITPEALTPVESIKTFWIDVAWNPTDDNVIAGLSRSFGASRATDGTIQVYDTAHQQQILSLQRSPNDNNSNISWLSNGTHLVVDYFDGSALVWNAETGELVNELVLPREGGRWLMAVSPFGGRVAFGNSAPDGALRTEGRQISPNVEVLAEGYVLMAVPLATEETLRGVLGRCALEPRSADALSAKIDPDAMSAFIAEVEALPPDAMIPACKADLLAVARAMREQ